MPKNMEDTLKDVGAKVGSSLDNAKDKVQDGKQDTINRLKDKVQDTADQAKEKGQEFINKASNQQGQRFEDFVGVADDEFLRLYGSKSKMETLIGFVRDRPLVALIIAIVTGAFCLKLLKCCCKRHKCK